MSTRSRRLTPPRGSLTPAGLPTPQDMRKNEDPRLSFSTPEFKEAQRTFTDGFKKNFGKPITYGLVKDYAWSTPQLRKLVRLVVPLPV